MSTMTGVAQICFEDVSPGDEGPRREYGPFTVVDSVRWAGVHENWMRMHYDRDYARTERGLPTFIASGAYRQCLLVRMLTDWIGPRGVLRSLTIRHVSPTYEGDLMRFSARVTCLRQAAAEDPWIRCEVEGRNQDDRPILTGRCTLLLPSRSAAGGRQP